MPPSERPTAAPRAPFAAMIFGLTLFPLVAGAGVGGYRRIPLTISVNLSSNRPDVPILEIPYEPGPDADASLVRFGARIEELDDRIAEDHERGSLKGAQLAAVIASRNIAVMKMSEGQEVLQGTSSGQFPSALHQLIVGILDALDRSLDSPTAHDQVHTRIEYVMQPRSHTAILYRPYGESSGPGQWETYTPNQMMALGTYIFEVRALNSANKFCDELVPVLADPTNRDICGAFTP